MSTFSSSLVEIDFSGIEAVQVGERMQDPSYIRLAWLGVHAYLASHLLKRPADLSWSDADLVECFMEIKAREPLIYNKAKRLVHGTAYGLTPYAMHMTFSDLYPTVKAAEAVQETYFAITPKLRPWHHALRQRAYEVGYLGGCVPDPPGAPFPFQHPYGYKHPFYAVVAYRPVTAKQLPVLERQRVPLVYMHGRPFQMKWGDDAKRVIAFYPQSIGAGNLKETMFPLFAEPDHPSYIGDAYFGRTPLRAPIHDSLLLEVPDRQLDHVLECAFREMLRPIEEQPIPPEWNLGSHLRIGVEAKVGKNWEQMTKIPTPKLEDLGLSPWLDVDMSLAGERTYFPAEEMEEEEVIELGTQMGRT